MATALVWFRRDLRLADNPAVAAAVAAAERVGFIATPLGHPSGASASNAWRTASLASLDRALLARGSTLAWREAPPLDALPELVRASGATVVHCSRDWTPAGLAEEKTVGEALGALGCELVAHEGSLLVAPDALSTADGRPYQVYTPFYRTWRRAWREADPALAPVRLPRPPALPAEPLPARSGDPRLGGWVPGEAGAHARLERFIADALDGYAELRDRPHLRSTSELSPHLAAGEVSPRQVVAAVMHRGAASAGGMGGGKDTDAPSASPGADTEKFIAELAWREFAAHVLYHWPDTQTRPMRPAFAAMPWCDDPEGFAAWCAGRTGYPLVDAGMRQLAATGWMHNRVRLVAASFLTKDLLVPWPEGERAFRDGLVDLDLASNVFNWQWVAGSGADAAPYFRIFNPSLQGARFDPDGDYVRRWVPELAEVPARWVHRPWAASAEVLERAGVRLGYDYPRPVVDHAEARDRALAAFAAVRDAPPPFV